MELFTAYRWDWVPHTWVDAVQLAAWLVLGLALVASARNVRGILRDPQLRSRVMLLAGLALAVRLLVPLLPFNWYSGVSNVQLGAPIYSKDTTYMPWPNQWITFTLGFYGILAFNIAGNILSAVLGWYVTRRAGYGERVALAMGLLIALTPMYVRISASDSTHMLALPLWWLATMSLQRLVLGIGDAVDRVLLFTVAMVTCPVRVEAGLVLPSVIFLVARDLRGLRQVWQARRRWSPFALGWILGMACGAMVQSHSWEHRLGQFDAVIFTIQMVARALFLVSLDPLGWIPLIYVGLIWYYLYQRRHDRAELAVTVLPFLFFSIPYGYSATAITSELPATAYGISLNMFLLLATAKGAALLYERWPAPIQRVPQRWRVAAIGLACLVAALSLLIPYRRTYAYMEEYAFLVNALPRQRAKILAIWDPAAPNGDFDCCLALPYPTLLGDYPELEWHILGQQDVDETHLRALDFDYYYPGSLVAVDVEHLNDWFIGRLFPDEEMNARQQAPLRALQSIDGFVRSHYELEIQHQETRPAHTFSWAPFRDDRMTLTLYRRVRPASASAPDDR